MINKNNQAFLALLRGGLWEKNVEFWKYDSVDFSELLRLALEQSVVGLVAAGLEHVKDVKVPQADVLQFVGQTLQIEQRNKAMNAFIADLIQRLRNEDIYTLLVKGQGVAQCYERPLWRSAGDIDFYLSKDNYEKAKTFLTKIASSVDEEDRRRMHLGMTIDRWVVELHGTMYTEISNRINKGLDDVEDDLFYRGSVRSWINGNVQIFLPSADNDIVIVFTHFLGHFYGEGIGLRQICDWCRLLWTYRESLNFGLLESRIKMMGVMSEWKAFGALAVEFLGMPEEMMPFYKKTESNSRKAKRILDIVLTTGNMGHNKDGSYRVKCAPFKRNVMTFWRRAGEFARISMIFPLNAVGFFITYVKARVRSLYM
jgi:hypothetical protein